MDRPMQIEIATDFAAVTLAIMEQTLADQYRLATGRKLDLDDERLGELAVEVVSHLALQRIARHRHRRHPLSAEDSEHLERARAIVGREVQALLRAIVGPGVKNLRWNDPDNGELVTFALALITASGTDGLIGPLEEMAEAENAPRGTSLRG